MAVSKTKRSRARYSVPKEYMDTFMWGLLFTYLVWAILWAFMPKWMYRSQDFVSEIGVAGSAGAQLDIQSNKVFSDRGRQMTLLYSVLIGFAVAILLHFAKKRMY